MPSLLGQKAGGEKPWFKNAGKLVTAGASTGAALVSIFSFLYSYGVIGKSESHQTIGNLGAAWVGLRPTADTATSIGDTVHLAATITDKNGAILVGAKPAWTTDNPNVATVLKDGSVIATGAGATTITVAVGDLFAKARIVVRQQVASVDVVGIANDTTPVIPEGESRPLRAIPRDARGYKVVGRVAQWRVDDTTVAALDTTAGVVAGRIAGRTIVAATVDGVSGHTAVTVIATAASLGTVAGADQRAAAGNLLSQAIVVRVTSRRGRPVEGTLVKFRPADGQGSVEPGAALTDADGRARTLWTLGDLPGRQTLLASVERVDSTLAVVAEAEPLAENTRVATMRDTVSGPAGQALSDPVAIRVTDSTGRALADVPVTWVALDGGIAEAINTRTDSLGQARARWTLGNRTGPQRLRAQVGTGHGAKSVAPVTLRAAALPGAAAGLVVVSGDGQRGPAGSPLARPVVIKVVDAVGNGVADASLELTPSAGSLRDTTVTTDEHGLAHVRWTLGRAAGEHALGVHLDGVDKLLKISARAVPAAPANLSFDDAPDGSSRHGATRQLVAIVTDAYGNPVSDTKLSFTAKQGAVSPSRAVSDAKGRVKLTWKLSPSGGEQHLVASVAGSDVRGSFDVHGAAPVVQAGSPAKKAPAKKAPAKPSSSRKRKR